MRSVIDSPWLWIGVSLLATASLVGCENNPDPMKGKNFVPPPVPPSYPAAQTVPLDPHLQAQARQELIGALHSNNPIFRAHALEGLRHAPGQESSAQIIAALGDPDASVRYAAALAAGELQLAEAHAQLTELLGDRDPRVRVAAIYALHRIGDTRHSHELEQTARYPEAEVRGSTAMALGMIGDPSGLKILRRMNRDPSPLVRQQVDEAMWRLGNTEGRDELIGWTVSGHPDDVMIALLGLAAPHDRSIIEHIRGQLVSSSEGPDWALVNLTAARALGTLGCDEGYGVAMRGAKSSDPRERILAAMAFGTIGRSDAQEMLRKLVVDSDMNVRIAAAEAVLRLKDGPYVPACGHDR